MATMALSIRLPLAFRMCCLYSNEERKVVFNCIVCFRYFLLCYHGVVNETNLSGDAANMMGPPDGMMMGNGLPVRIFFSE